MKRCDTHTLRPAMLYSRQAVDQVRQIYKLSSSNSKLPWLNNRPLRAWQTNRESICSSELKIWRGCTQVSVILSLSPGLSKLTLLYLYLHLDLCQGVDNDQISRAPGAGVLLL
jgi:hypothetical protein